MAYNSSTEKRLSQSCPALFENEFMLVIPASNLSTKLLRRLFVLKAVCDLALAIWSSWHGCREQIFVNISNAWKPWKPPKFLTFRCPQYEICPDGLSTRPQHHFTALWTRIVSKSINNTESSTNQVSIKQLVNAISSPEQTQLSDVSQIHYHSRYHRLLYTGIQ